MITRFDSLPEEINRQYQLAQENFVKAQEYGSQALFHAKNCGELLIEAKNQCLHGQWLNWLEAHTPISQRTAQRFMKIALNWDVIEAEMTSSENLGFGINDAQKLLTGQNKNDTMADLDQEQNQESKNDTMADLNIRDYKSFIFDSIERAKQFKEKLKIELKDIFTKYNSFEKFLSIRDSLDKEENIDLSNEEKLYIHEKSIMINMLETKYAEEDMRQVWLKVKIDFSLESADFDEWIKCEFNYPPAMINEFITTDKSLFFDLFFDYYTPEELVNKILLKS